MQLIDHPRLAVPFRAFFWALVFLLTGSMSCGAPQTRGNGPSQQDQEQSEPSTNQSTAEVRLTGPAALSVVPRLASFVIMVPDIELAASKLGRAKLVSGYPEIYDLMVADLVNMYGRDIIDPAQLADAGIDASGSFATGWLDLEGNVGFMVAEIQDMEQLTSTIAETARNMGAEVETETVEDATVQRVLRPNGQRAWWVLRDNLVLVILTWQEDAIARDYARMVARLAPRDSLAAAPFLKKTLDGLPDSPEDVIATIWANPGQVAQNLVQEQSSSPSGDNYAREQLKQARQSGNPEDVRYWEGVLREQNEWAEQRQASERAAMLFLREAIVPIRGVAFDVSILQREVHLAGFVDTGEDNLVAELLRNSEKLAPVARLQQESPTFLLHASFNKESLFRILELMMQISGSSIEDVSREVKESTGLDLQDDILAALDGDIGFAVWLDAARISTMGTGGPDPAIVSSFTVTLGVADKARLLASLEKVFGETLLAALARRDGDLPHWSLIVPGYKTIHVNLDKETLVVSTSKTASQELAANAPAPWLESIQPPEFSPWGQQDESAGIGLMDWMFSSLLFLSYGDYHLSSSHDPYPNVPLSDAARAIQDQIEAEEDKLEALRKEQRIRNTEAMLALVEIVGQYAAQGSRVDNGYTVHLGFLLGAESFPDTVGKAGQAIQNIDKLEAKHNAARQKLHTSINNLQQQFMQQREQDASQHRP